MLKKITIILKCKNSVVGTAKISGCFDGQSDVEIVISNTEKLSDGTLIVFGTQIAITDFYQHISTYKMPIMANDDIWCAIVSGNKIAVGGTGKVPTESEIKRLVKGSENVPDYSAKNAEKVTLNSKEKDANAMPKNEEKTSQKLTDNSLSHKHETEVRLRPENIVETEEKNDENQKGIKSLFDACEFAGSNFYLAVKPQLDELFVCHSEETYLASSVPNSKWVRVDADGGYFVVGLIYDGDTVAYVCYGVPAKRKSSPPPEIADACVWLPLDKKSGAGIEGYWVVYQDASRGNIL